MSPLKDENGKIIGLLKVVQNVTDYNAVVKSLVYSEEKYKDLFENVPLSMWVVEVSSLKFLDINKISITQFEYSKEEFLNMTALDLFSESEKFRILEIDRSVMNYKIPLHKWTLRKKSGKLVYVEGNSYEIIFEGRRARLVIILDITAERESKLLLEESHEQLKNLTEKIPLALVQIVMTSENKIQIPFISSGISDIYSGLNVENFKINPVILLDWIIEEDKMRVREEFNYCLKNQTDINLEFGIRNLHGVLSYLKVFYRIEKLLTGKITWYGYIEDITVQKKLLLDLENQNQQLKEIAWNQSHLVRAPLTTIMSLVNRLNKSGISLEEQRQLLEYLQKSANELDSVIKNIAKLSYKYN